MKTVPEFAVVGHPNEGKSSVLSTLAEDDSVRISPMPGETRECQSFPVSVDGKEIIRFIDTPGFQNPQKTLRWMQEYQGSDASLIQEFINAHQGDPDFHDDCSLLEPLLRGAGIIFVVDGSRPLRNMDRAEMEILRLTGCPRMAIINCKDEETDWLLKWQQEFRKHFNLIRIFNSCRATYGERIALLESLKSIDQDLQPVLDQVVSAFKQDWQERNRQVTELVLSFLEQGLRYSRSLSLKPGSDEAAVKSSLHKEYEEYLRTLEKKCQKQMRALYKHNIFNVELPSQSILQEDLFSGKTWEFLGLNSSQLIMAGAISGAAVGAGVDIAAAGMSFGIFSTIGGLVGAAGTAIKGREFLNGRQLLGMHLDNQQLRVGPVKNIQLLFVLLDRQFLFYSHIVNWAHGRRDYASHNLAMANQMKKIGFTGDWNRGERKVVENYWRVLQKNELSGADELRDAMGKLIRKTLREISLGENWYSAALGSSAISDRK
jgi:GTPase Era involved in 16S rRNA processing